MGKKKRFCIIAGLGIASAAFCVGVEYFVFTPASAPVITSQDEPVRAPAPAPATDAAEFQASDAPPLPPAKPELPRAGRTPAKLALAEPSPPALSHTVTEAMEVSSVLDEQSATAPAPPALAANFQTPAIDPFAQATKDVADELVAQSEEQPKAELPLSQAADPAPDEETELLLQAKAGYGVKYLSLKQSGAFGGVSGVVVPMNALSFEASLLYGKWNLRAGLEKFSADFSTDTTNPRLKDEKEFKSFFLKPGYGIFHLGVEGKTAPVVRTSGTSLDWADATALYGVGGFRIEKAYARRRPFLLGLELECAYPLSISGIGGPGFSSPSGFGLSLKGYAEKAVFRREEFRVNLGLEASAAYDKMSWEGSWAGSSGSATRTIQAYGSRLYLGIEF